MGGDYGVGFVDYVRDVDIFCVWFGVWWGLCWIFLVEFVM